MNRREFFQLLGLGAATVATTAVGSAVGIQEEEYELGSFDEWLSDVRSVIRSERSGCYHFSANKQYVLLEIYRVPALIRDRKQTDTVNAVRTFRIETSKIPQSEEFIKHVKEKYGRNLFLGWLTYGKFKKPSHMDRFIKRCQEVEKYQEAEKVYRNEWGSSKFRQDQLDLIEINLDNETEESIIVDKDIADLLKEKYNVYCHGTNEEFNISVEKLSERLKNNGKMKNGMETVIAL